MKFANLVRIFLWLHLAVEGLKKKIHGKEILQAWPYLLFETYLTHIDSVKLPLFFYNTEIRICSTELTQTNENYQSFQSNNFVNFKLRPCKSKLSTFAYRELPPISPRLIHLHKGF